MQLGDIVRFAAVPPAGVALDPLGEIESEIAEVRVFGSVAVYICPTPAGPAWLTDADFGGGGD